MSPARLSDDELQARIVRFGELLLQANEHYQTRTWDIEARSRRDHYWLAERALLRERSRRVNIVRRMEQERGLA